MELYEIDSRIAELEEIMIDPETGEIKSKNLLAEFEALQIDRSLKIENAALLFKNISASAEAIKAEKKKLAERQASLEKKAETIKNLISLSLAGEKFSTPKVEISFRKSQITIAGEDFVKWAKENRKDLLTYKEPTPDLNKIKKVIKSGEELPMASVETNYSIQIK